MKQRGSQREERGGEGKRGGKKADTDPGEKTQPEQQKTRERSTEPETLGRLMALPSLACRQAGRQRPGRRTVSQLRGEDVLGGDEQLLPEVRGLRRTI